MNYIEMKKCPKFYRCSAPICPLDPDFKKRHYVDGELKCTLPKNKRMRLGKTLSNKGLTTKELGGMKSWSNTPEEARKNIVKFGKKNLKRLVVLE